MHRIDEDGHVNNRFAEGDPTLGRQATRVGAPWLNAVQEELANAVTGRGVALDKANNGQLDERFRALEQYVDERGEWTYPEARTRGLIVPLELAIPFGEDENGPYWTFYQFLQGNPSWHWTSRNRDGVLQFSLGRLIPSEAVPTRLQIGVTPSRARADAADRMLFVVVETEFNFSGSGVLQTATTLASARDDGTGASQIVTMDIPPRSTINRSYRDLALRIIAGTEPGSLGDLVRGVRLTFADPGPRNY